MASPKKIGVLKGSKAQRPAAVGKAMTAAAGRIGAFHAGKNFAAKQAAMKPAPVGRPKAPAKPERLGQFEGAFKSADILRSRGTNAFGQKRK